MNRMICKPPLLEFLVRYLQCCLNAFLDLSKLFSFLCTNPQRISEERLVAVRFAVTTMHHILVRFRVLLIFRYNFCSNGPVIPT